MRVTLPFAEARSRSAHVPPVLWRFITICVLALSPLDTLVSQGRIVGEVRDTTGAGVVGAQISVAGSDLRAESDMAGRFVLASVPSGATTLFVRRLGFAPASITLLAHDDSTVHAEVVITEVTHGLAPVVVRAERPAHYTGYMAGFYERRDQGLGHFITGDEIEQRNPRRLTDMFRNIPGSDVSLGNPDSRVRMRGNQCAPLVWLDGMPAAAAEFDLDALVPTSVAGIEVYAGIAAVPIQFVMPFGRTACGTIIIWSKRGKPPLRSTITAAQLADRLTGSHVYTANQVDEPARVDSASLAAPLYPEALYNAHTPGRVVVEFVVDTTGKVDPETFSVVSSTDARFTEAVLLALPDARFKPAILGGHRVQQIVRQPFTFAVPPDGDKPRR